MHVLFINQAYAPDYAATAQHCEDLARDLIGRGHCVSVIASRSIYGKAGAKLPRHEWRDGIEVHRVGLSLFGKRGLLSRLLDFGLFYAAAAAKAFLIKRPDVVVTLTTPPFIGVLGGAMKRFRRVRHVYWAMDLYPDVLVAAGVLRSDALLTRLLERINRRCMRRADCVVALGRCMRGLIAGKGVRYEKVETIGVWAANPLGEPPSMNGTASSYRQEWGLKDGFVVQYSGNFGLAHDVDTVADAILRLRYHPRIKFVFVGSGKHIETIRNLIAEYELTNVMIQPYQDRARLDDLLRLADVHLITQAESFSGVVVPSKLFGILTAGRGALFIGPPTAEAALVIEEEGAGLTFGVGAGEALAEAILELTHNPGRVAEWGRRGLEAADVRHRAADRCAEWAALLSGLADRSKG